jgi:hypothetical protein
MRSTARGTKTARVRLEIRPHVLENHNAIIAVAILGNVGPYGVVGGVVGGVACAIRRRWRNCPIPIDECRDPSTKSTLRSSGLASRLRVRSSPIALRRRCAMTTSCSECFKPPAILRGQRSPTTAATLARRARTRRATSLVSRVLGGPVSEVHVGGSAVVRLGMQRLCNTKMPCGVLKYLPCWRRCRS